LVGKGAAGAAEGREVMAKDKAKRPRGTGCLYMRGNVYWIKYHRDGRAYYENTLTDVKGTATQLLQTRLGDIARGVPVTPQVNRCRVDEILEDVRLDYDRNNKKSIDKVESRIRLHLLPYFGGWRAATVTPADVVKFTDHRRAQGASNAEINRELSILQRGYSIARKLGKLIATPEITKLEENNVRQGYFEGDQFEAVRAFLAPPLQALVTFAYLTGWRIRSEVQTLEWRQVDFTAGVVRLEVGSTKNKKGRTFPFSVLPELRDLLERQRTTTTAAEHHLARKIPHVFHRNGKPIKDFYTAWDTACWKAGLATKDPETGNVIHNERIPHDFRRTAVRNLVRRGVSDRVAMLLTGHKTPSVFGRYDIINERDLTEAVEKLAGGPLVTEQLQTGTVTRLRAVTPGRK
jgi:integrase